MISEGLTGVSGTIPITNEPPAGTGVEFAIPEAYKDKPYLKDVTNIEDVYKKLDGAQYLIGQKVVFPTETSSPEEVLQFNKLAGVPEKPEDYVFEGEGRNLEIDNPIKAMLHKYGIPAKAATGLQKELEAMAGEAVKYKEELSDTEFNKLSAETFGEREAEVLASGKKLLLENIPEKLQNEFNEISNKDLILMSAVLDNIKRKYIDEDSTLPKGSLGGGLSKDALSAKVTELMKNPAYNDGLHKDHESVNRQITEICQQIARFA